MTAIAAEATTAELPHRGWSRDVGRLDVALVAASIAAAAVTLWIASEPIPSIFRLGLLDIAWPAIGVLWSLSVFTKTSSDAGRVIALLLAVAAGITFAGIVPFFVLLVIGPLPLAVGLLIAVAGFVIILAVERRPRVVWLAAPAIVLLTIAVAVSGVPRSVRFAAAEPELTAYAQGLIRDGAQPAPEGSDEESNLRIASYDVLWAYRRDGCAYLGTAYVGILDDVEAGLAYCPTGLPAGSEQAFDALSGNWYRWAALGFD